MSSKGVSKMVSFLKRDHFESEHFAARMRFATFVYRNHSKDTAARERGGKLFSGGSPGALDSTSVEG